MGLIAQNYNYFDYKKSFYQIFAVVSHFLANLCPKN